MVTVRALYGTYCKGLFHTADTVLRRRTWRDDIPVKALKTEKKNRSAATVLPVPHWIVGKWVYCRWSCCRLGRVKLTCTDNVIVNFQFALHKLRPDLIPGWRSFVLPLLFISVRPPQIINCLYKTKILISKEFVNYLFLYYAKMKFGLQTVC